MALERLLAAGAVVMLLSSMGPAQAAARDKHAPSDLGSVTACSQFGSQCITSRARKTQLGLQYRSHFSTWPWCEISCEDTLRRNRADFWHDQRERSR